jgi:peptidoglycan hydrolase CwlO-like protein
MRQDEVVVKQQSDQQLTIDSLVDLLERQRIDHANISMAHHDEVRRLKEEMSTLQAKHHASMAEMKDKVASSTELILALTVELQNTRNEICAYRHKQKDQS